jgi:hypothetical protein
MSIVPFVQSFNCFGFASTAENAKMVATAISNIFFIAIVGLMKLGNLGIIVFPKLPKLLNFSG